MMFYDFISSIAVGGFIGWAIAKIIAYKKKIQKLEDENAYLEKMWNEAYDESYEFSEKFELAKCEARRQKLRYVELVYRTRSK